MLISEVTHCVLYFDMRIVALQLLHHSIDLLTVSTYQKQVKPKLS